MPDRKKNIMLLVFSIDWLRSYFLRKNIDGTDQKTIFYVLFVLEVFLFFFLEHKVPNLRPENSIEEQL